MGGILLIDAEQPFADQLTGSLKGRGFSVKLLDDGKDGLDYARDNKPDLIILCVELPKMSGYSICNKLKKDNDLKSIPLIITSKEATPETFAQHKKLKTRAEDYLIKPFTDGELVEKIAALDIKVPSGGNGAAAAPAPAPAPAAPDAFDALESLGADLDLGAPSGGGESSVKLDDSDLSALDVGESSQSASAGLGLSPEDDALLASLDDLGGSSPSAVPGIDDLDLGPSVKADDGLAGFDQAFESITPEKEAMDTSPPPAAKPAPAPAPAPEPVAARPAPAPEPVREPPPRTDTRDRMSMAPQASAADLQQLQQLRRDNTDLKTKVAELEARLKAAQDDAKAARESAAAATATAASGGGSAREVLNLKEQLRAKDKEISALKDEVFEKEKAALEAQEAIDKVKADAQHAQQATQQAVKSKDVEISTLQAKLKAVEEERDELEQQVQGRMRQAEADRDEARASLEQAQNDLARAKSDLDRVKAHEDKLKMDVDRAKVDVDNEKKAAAAARTQAEAKIKELEGEVRTQEERALKAYQRLKTEETLREKAKKAVEIAFTLLNGDVETGGKSADLDQLDAE